MKRSDPSSSSEASAPESKKRKVAYSTYQKLKTELDRDCQTVSWLECHTEVSGKKSRNCDVVCVLNSRRVLQQEETLVRSGFWVLSRFEPATFEIMPRLTSTPMR